MNLLKTKKLNDAIDKVAKDYKENDFKYNFYIKEVILKLICENEEEDKKDYEKKQKTIEDMDEEDL